jgi:hypothetical protein
MKKLPLQVYLDAHDHALLERLARAQGLAKAEAVRVAIRRWATEAAGSADPVLDLLGAMDRPDLPSDLSTRHDEYAVARPLHRQVAEPKPAGRRRR